MRSQYLHPCEAILLAIGPNVPACLKVVHRDVGGLSINGARQGVPPVLFNQVGQA